jgi:hypothetical protein
MRALRSLLAAASRALLLGGVAALAALIIPREESRGQSAPSSPMDRPIALLEQTQAELRRVADYECKMVSQERVNDVLIPEKVMTMRARRQPYSIYLHFESPDALHGQQICYVAGRNKGMMRVRPAGWRGIVGFVSIDLWDPRAIKESRHTITEATLWSVMDSTARYWTMERKANKTAVQIEERLLFGQPCIWIETTHPDRKAGAYYAYRCVLCLDKATHLPVRIEAYDWPRPNGPAGGELLECCTYADLRCNIGLGDKAFDY